MKTVLMFAGILGIAQSALLAAAFFQKRLINRAYSLLSLLCFFLSLILLAILLPVSESVEHMLVLEVLEYTCTFAFGPVLYLLCMHLLDQHPSAFRKILIIHFIPAILYAAAALFWGAITHEIVSLPIWVPLLHLQSYTIWMIFRLLKASRQPMSSTLRKHTYLLGGLSLLLVTVHLLQWLRFFYPEIDGSEFLIPIGSFVILYALLLFFLFNSKDLFELRKQNGLIVAHDEIVEEAEKIRRALCDHKLFRENGLTVDLLAERVKVPAHKVSYLINHEFGRGFNEFVNAFRIEEAKQILTSSEYDHYTVEAISREVGFNSRTSFYSAFKKETGMTPASYKDRMCSDS